MNELFELDELIQAQELYEVFPRRRGYVVRERRDHFNHWNEDEFFHRFRFSKTTAREIVNLVRPQLLRATERYFIVMCKA